MAGESNEPVDHDKLSDPPKLADDEGSILRRVETPADRDREDEADSYLSTLVFLKDTIIDLVWPDLILSHLDKTSLKIIFRSWVMMWSLTLLQICHQTEVFMGPSSFLANFAAGIEISGNLSVSSAVVHCSADVISVLFSAAISVVTHAINWKIRGLPSEQQILKELADRNLCTGSNPTFENCIIPVMHGGEFLDIRVTAVTIFGMLFSFTICGYFQCISKYFQLAWLLNSLYTIIVFPFNNYMPVWRPWEYARNCVVPMCIAFTMRLAVSLFMYPFSSNNKVVGNFSMACTKLMETCKRVRTLSQSAIPSENDFSSKFSFINTETQATFSKYIVNEIDMEMVTHLEIWFSRFEKPDLSDLQAQIRLIMSGLSSFNFFFEAVSNRYQEITTGEPAGRTFDAISKSDMIHSHRFLPNSLRKRLGKTWKATSVFENTQRQSYIRASAHDRDSNFYAILSSTKINTAEELDGEFSLIIRTYEPLLNVTCELLEVCAEWLELSRHNFPWWPKNLSDKRTKCITQLNHLIEALNHELLTAKKNSPVKDQLFALHGYVCRHFARAVRGLAKGLLIHHKERPHPILVVPHRGRRGRISTSVVDVRDPESYENFVDGGFSNLTAFKPLKRVQARNPDSSPPRRVWHLFGRMIEILQAIAYDGEFLFSLKRAVLTTVTLTPYFVRPICRRAFHHWYLWVAVLTAYTVARQAVDGIYGFFGKLVFNFFGCLVGMIGWYISAGSGNGNPFGYAAVTAFVWLYICYQRQFNKHFTGSTSVVYSCTVTLVLGNSWNAGHISLQDVELGKGFSVAWVRFVTVTIGISVAFIGTVFPYVYTAKKAVRQIVGSCLEKLGELQAMVSNFGFQRYQINSTRIIAHTDEVTKAARAIITNLNSAETLRKRLIYEPPLSGLYPSHRYKVLIRYVREVTLLYSLIHGFLDDIEDTAVIPEILALMGWTDPKLCSAVFSLMYMSGRAIIDGQALPSISPANLKEQYIFDLLKARSTRIQSGELKSNDAIITATALSLQIYERLDVVTMLIKELVGEVYDIDMDIFDLEKQDRTPLLQG